METLRLLGQVVLDPPCTSSGISRRGGERTRVGGSRRDSRLQVQALGVGATGMPAAVAPLTTRAARRSDRVGPPKHAPAPSRGGAELQVQRGVELDRVPSAAARLLPDLAVAPSQPPIVKATPKGSARRPAAAAADSPPPLLIPPPTRRPSLRALADEVLGDLPTPDVIGVAASADAPLAEDDAGHAEDGAPGVAGDTGARPRDGGKKHWKAQVDILLMGHEQPGAEALPDEVFERLLSKIEGLKPAWRPMTSYLYSLGLR